MMTEAKERMCGDCGHMTRHIPEPSTDVSIRWVCTECEA